MKALFLSLLFSTATLFFVFDLKKTQSKASNFDSNSISVSTNKMESKPVLPHTPQREAKKIAPSKKDLSALIDKNKGEEFSDWNFDGTSLTREEIKPWLKKGGISQVYFYEDYDPKVFEAKTSNESQEKNANILFISTEKQVRAYALQRALELANQRGNYEVESEDMPLSSDDYEVYKFIPGFHDDRKSRIALPNNIMDTIRGPDYSFENVDPEDFLAIENIRSRVLSLGHEGRLILKVKNNGFIVDKDGADFVIFENVFHFGEGKLYQEFANVGVSELAEGPVKWFHCDPKQNVLKGCAGVVPTSEGGDLFDLADIHEKKIQYLHIRDLGYNHSLAENTEGFDFDAARLIHAISLKF